MRYLLCLMLVGITSRVQAIPHVARDPYVGAILLNADTGETLFAERADEQGYPASMLKMMDLLIILEQIESGRLHYTDQVKVTAEASKVGGSQVYLAENEVFTIEDLLYALMVQSANDAATALAIHIAGSKEEFIRLMNIRAGQLGMTSTKFNSVHGLPPAKGGSPDLTTARDFSKLALELLKHPDALKFTSTVKREFRAGTAKPFTMENHNHLLKSFPGCDGFKTGYITAAGFSMAATAKRGDVRVICVILGSKERETRDTKAAALMSRGFLIIPPPPPPPPPPPVVTNAPVVETPPPAPPAESGFPWLWAGLALLIFGSAVALGIRMMSGGGKGEFLGRKH